MVNQLIYNMLYIDKLGKHFAGVKAVDRISFKVEKVIFMDFWALTVLERPLQLE